MACNIVAPLICCVCPKVSDFPLNARSPYYFFQFGIRWRRKLFLGDFAFRGDFLVKNNNGKNNKLGGKTHLLLFILLHFST